MQADQTDSVPTKVVKEDAYHGLPMCIERAYTSAADNAPKPERNFSGLACVPIMIQVNLKLVTYGKESELSPTASMQQYLHSQILVASLLEATL